ncbi:MAG: hypothetical protein ACRD0C_12960, partial [Acidimicrobiia bacterium]
VAESTNRSERSTSAPPKSQTCPPLRMAGETANRDAKKLFFLRRRVFRLTTETMQGDPQRDPQRAAERQTSTRLNAAQRSWSGNDFGRLALNAYQLPEHNTAGQPALPSTRAPGKP